MGFIVVAAISLLFLSGLIVIRLGAGGASTRQIAIVLFELWLLVAVWILVLKSLADGIGQPNTLNVIWAAVRIGLALLVVLLLRTSLRKAMHAHPVIEGEEK